MNKFFLVTNRLSCNKKNFPKTPSSLSKGLKNLWKPHLYSFSCVKQLSCIQPWKATAGEPVVPKFFTRKIEPAKGCCCFSSDVKRALKFKERFKLKKKKRKGKRSDNEEEKEPIPSLPCCHIFDSSRPTSLRDFHSYGMQSTWLSLSSRKTSKTAT